MNDCLILIDKPLNLTSNHVLQSVKKRLNTAPERGRKTLLEINNA